MTNSKLLQESIESSGISITFVAKYIGISREGFYKKLNGVTEFKASEIMKIAELLHLNNTTRDNIFFAPESELNSRQNNKNRIHV